MKLQDRLNANAHWLLRFAIVGVFLYHGILKFSNLDGFATMLPISFTQVVFVALANVGSVLVILGGFRNDRLSDLAKGTSKTECSEENKSVTTIQTFSRLVTDDGRGFD